METIQETIDSHGVYHAETHIATEEWTEMLADGTIAPKQLEALLCIYREPNHEAACNVLAQKYGGTSQFYNNAVWQTGKRVQQRLARFEVVGVEEDGTPADQNAYWCILADGRKSKKGFVYTLKPELCETLESYLYLNLLNVYKQHRKEHSLTDDDELYKWQIVDGCKDKDVVEQVVFTLQYPHQNLIGWRKIAELKPFAANHTEEFQLLLKDLYKVSDDLQSRLKAFFKGLKEYGVDCDERTVSVFLTCHSPQQYSFYTDTYYRQLCEYLGEKPHKAGEKYVHFISLLSPLVHLVKNDEDIHLLLASDLNDMVDSPWLIAQDIIYILFTHSLITMRHDIFDWIPFYEELATKLLDYKDKRSELASLIYENFDREKEIKFLHDGDGSDFEEIDPFTVFSIINRSMNCRMDMMRKMKDLFELDAAVPTSVEGIPVQHPMKASYICFTKDRKADGKDLDRWWHLFESAQQDGTDIEDLFNTCLQHAYIAIPKLTMGLFYLRPYKFLALDGNNRAYLTHYGIVLDNYAKMQWSDYKQLLQNVNVKMRNGEIGEQTFPEFSANAYDFKSNPMTNKYQKYIDLLTANRNIVLTGAPGTGKTYMAKAIVAEMGAEEGFVQFHPSYDYTDFVEGLRPIHQEGNIGFERKDGVFKAFCERAFINYRDSQKSTKELNTEREAKDKLDEFINNAIEKGEEAGLSTSARNNPFVIVEFIDDKIRIRIPHNEIAKDISVSSQELLLVLQDKNAHVTKVRDYVNYLYEKGVRKTSNNKQEDSYAFVIYEKVRRERGGVTAEVKAVERKPFVFIIDEINRGEISKIFGELFYSIDPGYRYSMSKREKESYTAVRTQYANMQDESNAFDSELKTIDFGHFFVPDNVYIIGTMNDIDRSVESMDFAMRRRFAWVEVKADDELSLEMLDELGCAEEAKVRMANLNRAILNVQGLNEAYQIGAAYFRKMKDYVSFDQLWENHIKGLLREYLRGNRNQEEELKRLHAAFNDTTDHTTEKASATEETTEASVAEQPQE